MIETRAVKGSGTPPMVTVSALGQHVFCPESARLAFLGVRPSRQARESMGRGAVAHDRWQRQEDLAPGRQRRLGRLVLLIAAILALLAVIWSTIGPSS